MQILILRLLQNLRTANFQHYYTMSDNKLVKTIMDAATLTGLSASIKCGLEKRWFFQQVKKISILLHVQMASIGMIIRGAIINTVAFTGSNHLASYLSGNRKAAFEEKKQHDKAIEAYNALTPNTRVTAPSFLVG